MADAGVEPDGAASAPDASPDADREPDPDPNPDAGNAPMEVCQVGAPMLDAMESQVFSVIGQPKEFCVIIPENAAFVRVRSINRRSCLSGALAITLTNSRGEASTSVANHVTALELQPPPGQLRVSIAADRGLIAACDFHTVAAFVSAP